MSGANTFPPALPTDDFTVIHGATSSTFHPPPLDGSMVIFQLLDYNAEHSPDHVLYAYVDQYGVKRTLNWSDVSYGVRRAAKWAASSFSVPGSHENPPVVAILANTDAITYTCVTVGLQRAGYLPFPILLMNPTIDVAVMLKSMDANHLIRSLDQSTFKYCDEVLTNTETVMTIIDMPVFEDLFPMDTKPNPEELLPPILPNTINLDYPAVVHHTSGTTGTPKLRTYTHRILVERARTPWYGERDLCGEMMCGHAFITGHASSSFLYIWPASTGLSYSLYHPSTPSIPPSPQEQLNSATGTDTSLLYAMADFFEVWNSDPASVKTLRNFKALVVAPLDEAIGNRLASHGIPIWHIYAATEMGCLTKMMPESSLKFGWEWYYFSPHIKPVMIPRKEREDIFELAVLKHALHTPAVINSTIRGQPAYLSGDLLIKHPTEPNLWKYFGRVDDQIVLASGEETNPCPIEYLISKCPLATNALIFGEGKIQNGVLIEPSAPFDSSDPAKLCEFRDNIWPNIERANSAAPVHSRISKELIIVSNPLKPLEYTLKRMPRRRSCFRIYQDEIEAVYAQVEVASKQFTERSVHMLSTLI